MMGKGGGHLEVSVWPPLIFRGVGTCGPCGMRVVVVRGTPGESQHYENLGTESRTNNNTVP